MNTDTSLIGIVPRKIKKILILKLSMRDTQCAVYDVMDLMSEREEMYAILKELELLHLLPEKIRKQLKTKFDCLRETKPPGRINIFLDNKTK